MPAQADTPALSAPARTTPLFTPSEALVIFVLGGPGAGKGTLCAALVRDYAFTHLSAGDLLRAEQARPGSEFGEMIARCIRDGQIVPMDVTIQLLENAMRGSTGGGGRFLIDGFPRAMDQARAFEARVVRARFALFLDCPEGAMQARLLKRGETSGRADDNAESIQKRFRTFVETSMPVVEHFGREGRVVRVSAVPAPEEVYREVKRRMAERGIAAVEG